MLLATIVNVVATSNESKSESIILDRKTILSDYIYFNEKHLAWCRATELKTDPNKTDLNRVQHETDINIFFHKGKQLDDGLEVKNIEDTIQFYDIWMKELQKLSPSAELVAYHNSWIRELSGRKSLLEEILVKNKGKAKIALSAD